MKASHGRAAARRRVRRALAVAGLVLVGLAVAAPPAAGHAALLATDPPDGAVLDDVPAVVTLEFNEPVEAPPAAVRVFDREGRRVDEADASAGPGGPHTVTTSLREGLPDGTYVATWGVVSADAHPIRGAFMFTVGAVEEGADAPDLAAFLDQGGEGFSIAATGLRWARFLTTLFAAGALFFLWVVPGVPVAAEERLRRGVRRTALAGIAVTLLALPVQGAVVSGLGARALVDGGLLAGAAASSLGVSALVGVLGLAGVALLAPARRHRWSGLALSAMALGSFALTGHQVTAEPRLPMVAGDLVHLGAAAVWFGGLVALAVGLAAEPGARAQEGARMVARFSALAAWSVVAVAGSGAVMGWVEVRAAQALRTTAYGWTLVGKTALVAAILGIAAYNNRRLVPAIRRSDAQGDARSRAGAWRRLQRTVRAEATLMVLVLGVTAVLVNLTPARVEAGVTGPFSAVVALGDRSYVLTVDPNRAGRNELHVQGFGPGTGFGEWTGEEELVLRFSNPARDVAPVEREPLVAGPHHWVHTGRELAFPGRWAIEMELRIDDFERRTATVQVDVGG